MIDTTVQPHLSFRLPFLMSFFWPHRGSPGLSLSSGFFFSLAWWLLLNTLYLGHINAAPTVTWPLLLLFSLTSLLCCWCCCCTSCSLVVIWQRPLFSVQHEGRWCRQRCSLQPENARKGEVREWGRDVAGNVELRWSLLMLLVLLP